MRPLGAPRRPRLRLRCANGTFGAQRAGRCLGIVGAGQRAHHGDPVCAGGSHGGDVRRVDPADGEERRPRVSGRIARRARCPRPGGPAWSGWRGRARPRCSRRRAQRPCRSAPASAWRARSDDLRPPLRARRRRRLSSWPTCTPSAPAAATRSGRSLRMNSAPWAAHARAKRWAVSSSDAVVGRILDAQLDDVDAAAQSSVEEGVGLRVADQVQPSVCQASSSVVHVASLAGAER